MTSKLTSPKRLYIFTGKGGVGKSTLAIAFSHHLLNQGHSVLYVSIDQFEHEHLFSTFNLPFEYLDLISIAKNYMAQKLNSKTVASWIIKVPFFKALLMMNPGFSYVVYLGYLLDKILKDNKDLIVVLDSPATGHTLTMFESLYHFKEIFNTGVLVDDINKILKHLSQEDILKLVICTVPTRMAIHEGAELKENLIKINSKWNPQLIINNSLATYFQETDLAQQEAPKELITKIEQENKITQNYSSEIKTSLPFSPSIEYKGVITDLTPHMAALV